YFFGANSFARARHGTIAETFRIHLFDHGQRAAILLGLALREQVEMRSLGGDKKHGRGILAHRDAGAASNASGRIHRAVGNRFPNRQRIAVRGSPGVDRNESARLDDTIEGVAVSDQVFDNREGFGAPGLNRDGLAILEMAHVQLTGGRSLMSAMRNPVNNQGTHPANPLAAIRIKAIGSCPRSRIPSLTTSSISRNDMSSSTSFA